MYGQLNLFSFKPKLVIYYPTPFVLNQKLWSVVRKTDNRGYSFRNFELFGQRTDKRGRPLKKVDDNWHCITSVIYKAEDDPIGFCTVGVELHSGPVRVIDRQKKPSLNVWVMPYYRDMGFGSLLVNASNEMSLKLVGDTPYGHDKNHTACWDKRFRNRSRDEYDPYKYCDSFPEEQLPLFRQSDLDLCRQRTLQRIIASLSRSVGIDPIVSHRFHETINYMFREFRYRRY